MNQESGSLEISDENIFGPHSTSNAGPVPSSNLYCGGICLALPTEYGDPLTALWLDQKGLTVGTAKGRLVGIRLQMSLSEQVPINFIKPSNLGALKNAERTSSQKSHLNASHNYTSELLDHRAKAIHSGPGGLLGHLFEPRCPSPIDVPVDLPPGVASGQPSRLNFGPGAAVHNHTPLCSPPPHTLGIYAAHHPGPIRMIYETQNRLHCVVGSDQVFTYNRHYQRRYNHHELQKIRGSRASFVHVLQSLSSSTAAIITSENSAMVDIKKNEPQMLDFDLENTVKVPTSFNGTCLLVAVNYTDQRSLRIYKTRFAHVSPRNDDILEGWLNKPLSIVEIPLPKAFIGPSTLWGFDMVVVTVEQSVYCFAYDADEDTTEPSTYRLTDAEFRVDVNASVANILGCDREYIWILTKDVKLYKVDRVGQIIAIYDLSPATLHMEYPVLARIIASSTYDTGRFYAFTADRGVFLAALHTMTDYKQEK